MAEISLTQNGTTIVLPVLPAGYTVSTSQGNTTVNVNALGEVNLFGLPNLDVISFESFFPAEAQTFSLSSISTPEEYKNQIIEFKETGPVKLHLLDVLSTYCTIETFEYYEQDGTGDIYYSIELKKYIFINAEGLTSDVISSTGRSDDDASGSSSSNSGGTYTVKTGDCLWSIARTQLGTSDWTELYNLNADVIGDNPNLIYAGQVLTLPS